MQGCQQYGGGEQQNYYILIKGDEQEIEQPETNSSLKCRTVSEYLPPVILFTSPWNYIISSLAVKIIAQPQSPQGNQHSHNDCPCRGEGRHSDPCIGRRKQTPELVNLAVVAGYLAYNEAK